MIPEGLTTAAFAHFIELLRLGSIFCSELLRYGDIFCSELLRYDNTFCNELLRTMYSATCDRIQT